jgi:HTH-type transcriptional regulator / antitoxin MqsA
MTYSHVCPFCEEGTALEYIYSSHVKLGRRSVLVDGLKKTVCDLCGSESVPDEFHDANLALIQQAGESCRGAVTEGMLRNLRETWKLTQTDASKLFGAGKSSFAKWESKQSKLSTPSALLIQVALHVPHVMPYLAKLANLELPQSTKTNESKARLPRIQGAYEAVQLFTDEASNGIWMQSCHRTPVRTPKRELPNDIDWGATVVSSGGAVEDCRTLLEAA